MCGIFAYLGKKDSIKACIKGLKLLEYRGYDSAGIAAINNGKILHFKSSGKISNLEKKISIKNIKLNLAIGHTRWATHGVANALNAHPHFDDNFNLALVHNGIIENYNSIKKFLIKKNYKFRSETDTEVIAQLISYYYKNDLMEATRKAIKEFQGSFAIALIHKNHPGEIVVASKESPIAIGFDDLKNEIIVSSDPNAFLGRNLNVIFLNNDEVAHIKEKTITVFNQNFKKIKKKTEKLNSKSVSFSKDGFEHYMLKEIYEQPITIQKAYLGRILEDKGNAEFENLKHIKKFLSKVDNIIITACGTSYNAATIGVFFIQEKADILTRAEIASEMRFKNLKITKNTLVIAISQSGETADTLAAIREVKKKGAKILSIINKENSSIARDSDFLIFLKAGPELSVCSTKAFTSQITVLYLFSIYMARMRKMKKKEALVLIKELKKIPLKIKKILKQKETFKKMAKKYAKFESFFYLGRNLMYPTAKEAALKLKEISYLNANAYPAGEMKHGPLALINSKLPIIAFSSNEKTFDKLLSNLMEAKARSAPILAFASKKAYGIEDIADDVIWLEKTTDDLAIFLSSVAGQLLAYYIAKERKTDIDQPRNLAKSVTVE